MVAEPASAAGLSHWFIRPVPDDEPLYRFGDIIEAPWLVALYLRYDAQLIHIQGDARGGGKRVYLRPLDTPLSEDEKKNLVQAHADDLISAHGLPRRAVILSDDCEIRTRMRARTGRIQLAGVAKLPDAPDQREAVLAHDAFSRFVVLREREPNGEGFKIDFPMSFAIATADLEKTSVVFRPADEDVRQAILSKWAAHSTRHGPSVAKDGGKKLAKLIEANGNPATVARLQPVEEEPSPRFAEAVDPLVKVLGLTWLIEGRLLDRVSDDLEAGQPPRSAVDDVVLTLRQIESAAAEARTYLDAVTPAEPWKP